MVNVFSDLILLITLWPWS